MEDVFKAFFEKKIDEIHFGGLFLNFMEKLVTLVDENYLKARLKKIQFDIIVIRSLGGAEVRRTPFEKKHRVKIRAAILEPSKLSK